MKCLTLAVFLALAACGANINKPLPMVKDSDPVTRLNPDRWGTQVNNLITPPEGQP